MCLAFGASPVMKPPLRPSHTLSTKCTHVHHVHWHADFTLETMFSKAAARISSRELSVQTHKKVIRAQPQTHYIVFWSNLILSAKQNNAPWPLILAICSWICRWNIAALLAWQNFYMAMVGGDWTSLQNLFLRIGGRRPLRGRGS